VNVSRILCTLLLCGSLAIEANAANRAGAANGADAANRAGVANRASAANVAGAANRDAAMAGGDRPVTAQHIVGPAGRGNADRLRSLLGSQARGRVARQPTRRPVGSARAPAIGGSTGQGWFGANPARFGASPMRQTGVGVGQGTGQNVGQSTAPSVGPSVGQRVGSLALAAPPKGSRSAPTLSALAIHSTSGAHRAAGLAVVGGPVIGRAVHTSTIDGTQARHKF
jgi:hypothetical protein